MDAITVVMIFYIIYCPHQRNRFHLEEKTDEIPL